MWGSGRGIFFPGPAGDQLHSEAWGFTALVVLTNLPADAILRGLLCVWQL